MPNPYPVALRERAVRAYEDSTDTYQVVATRYAISVNALVRWVQRARSTGEYAPRPKGGGWRSPVDLPTLHRLVAEQPDRTTDEVTRVYNRTVAAAHRVHRSSIVRALLRSGYVFKKTIATGGTGSCPRPRRTRCLPAVGHHGRPAAPRLPR